MKKYILLLAGVCCFALGLKAQEIQKEAFQKENIKEKETQEIQKQGKEIDAPQKNEDTKQSLSTQNSPEVQKESLSKSKPTDTKSKDLKSQNSSPHYKGKWTYAAKTEFRAFKSSFSRGKDSAFIGDIVFYQAGVGYNILDSLKIAAYIGLSLEGGGMSDFETKADGALNIAIPIEVTLGYSITNFLNYKKNIEVYVGIGYDQGVYDLFQRSLISKAYGDIGISFGKTVGFKLYYAPYTKIGSYAANANVFGAGFVFRWN